MDYQSIFGEAIDALHAEGRYRVFADLERHAGRFPRAIWRSDEPAPTRSPSGAPTTISAWASTRRCSRPCTRRPRTLGAGAGGTRNISGTNHPQSSSKRSSPTCTARKAALLFTSGYVSNDATLSTLGQAAARLRRSSPTS